MKGLTSKVFRTFNASYVLQDELDKIKGDSDSEPDRKKIEQMVFLYNKANKHLKWNNLSRDLFKLIGE